MATNQKEVEKATKQANDSTNTGAAANATTATPVNTLTVAPANTAAAAPTNTATTATAAAANRNPATPRPLPPADVKVNQEAAQILLATRLQQAFASLQILTMVHKEVSVMENTQWQNAHLAPANGSLTFNGNRTYKLAGYCKTTTSKGQLVAKMSYSGDNTHAGTLTIGARFPNKCILTLAKLHKSQGQDFGIHANTAAGLETVVINTPQANYNTQPIFAQGANVFYHCQPDDFWFENAQGLEKYHTVENTPSASTSVGKKQSPLK
jgi:hypothetical protein